MPRTATRSMNDEFDDDTPKQGGANCSDSTKRSAYQEALILKIGVESAQATAKAKLGAYRAYLKAAAKKGVSTDAITNALAKRMEDPDLVVIEERERLKMYDLAGFIPGVRDKILTRMDVQEATDTEEEQNQVLIAYDRGVTAGRSGHPKETNPYPTGSLGERKWLDGWRGGQQAIADGMPVEPVVEAPHQTAQTDQPRRRGRKPREDNGLPLDHPSGDLPAGVPLAVH